MNGYRENGLDDDAFGPSKGGIVSSFDAFREFGLQMIERHTNTHSQNQEDISRARPQFLRMDRNADPHMHLACLDRNLALVRRHNDTDILRRKGRLARHADQPRHHRRYALR